MNSIDPFLNNLVITCQKDAPMREDGKTLSFWNRIADFFHRKSSDDHFETVCQKLSTAQTKDKIKTLSFDQRIEILSRITHLYKERKNHHAFSSSTEFHIRELEKSVFENQDPQLDHSFSKIESTITHENEKELYHELKKLETFLEHYVDKPDVIENAMEKWDQVFSKIQNDSSSNKTYILLSNAHRFIQEKFLKAQETILLKMTNVEDYLIYYPSLLKFNLEVLFKNHNYPEIYSKLQTMKILMDRYKDHEDFIFLCGHNINEFLGKVLFQDQMTLSEMKKQDLLAYRELFDIFDTHLPTVAAMDEKLALDLKIKLSNLPCPSVRSNFPNIHLSEKDQLDILVTELQRKEDQAILQLLSHLKEKNPSSSDLSRLAKFVQEDSRLSEKNRNLLRSELQEKFGIENWDNYRQILSQLEEAFLLKAGSTDLTSDLQRLSKAKAFFQDQIGLDEEMICIPRWFHATNHWNLQGILTKGKIKVRDKKDFPGAWVSDKRERQFGGYALAITQKVTQINPEVLIRHEKTDRRWRGVQEAVHIKPSATFVLLSVPNQKDKAAQKTDKLHHIKILKEKGIENPTVISASQLDFMQQEVMSILGTPNLPDTWWGKGRIYSDHQAELHQKVTSQEIDAELFKVQSSEEQQSAIALIIQEAALPLYKEAMPPNPSYHKSSIHLRVELSKRSSKAHQKHLDQIQAKTVPARGLHGSMHCVRTALWTQVLTHAYEKLGHKPDVNPILLATGGAFHDCAREDEGIDYWDSESSKVLESYLEQAKLPPYEVDKYVHALREKDPERGRFTSDAQRIVHDADCLEIIRVVGKWNFNPKYLCLSRLDQKQKDYCDALVKEIGDFITITENYHVRNYLEHYSSDFYGDLVRLMFAIHQQKQSFPLITELIKDDMQGILQNPDTSVTEKLLKILKYQPLERG